MFVVYLQYSRHHGNNFFLKSHKFFNFTRLFQNCSKIVPFCSCVKTKEHIERRPLGRAGSILTLKHTVLGQNRLFLGLTALVYLAFRLEGGSLDLELLHSLIVVQTQKIKVSLSCQIKRIQKFNCNFIKSLTPLCNARAMFLFLSSFVAIVMSQRSFIFIFCISIECRDKLQMVWERLGIPLKTKVIGKDLYQV